MSNKLYNIKIICFFSFSLTLGGLFWSFFFVPHIFIVINVPTYAAVPWDETNNFTNASYWIATISWRFHCPVGIVFVRYSKSSAGRRCFVGLTSQSRCLALFPITFSFSNVCILYIYNTFIISTHIIVLVNNCNLL